MKSLLVVQVMVVQPETNIESVYAFSLVIPLLGFNAKGQPVMQKIMHKDTHFGLGIIMKKNGAQ